MILNFLIGFIASGISAAIVYLLMHQKLKSSLSQKQALLESQKRVEAKQNLIQNLISEVELKQEYRLEQQKNQETIEALQNDLGDVFSQMGLLYKVSNQLAKIHTFENLKEWFETELSEHIQSQSYSVYLQNTQGSFDLFHEQDLACPESLKIEAKPQLYQLLNHEKSHHVIQFNPFNNSEDQSVSYFVKALMHYDTLSGFVVVKKQSENLSIQQAKWLNSIFAQMAVVLDRCQLHERLKNLSIRDDLTGVYNRRYFFQMLELEFKRAQRFQRSLSLIMLDIDHFKKINDQLGHLKGDQILKTLTHIISSSIREYDLFARFGGEEFVIILPHTNVQGAQTVAEKIHALMRTKVKNELIEEGIDLDFHGIDFSVSLGLADYPSAALSPKELIHQADMALYQAKRQGRKQTCSAAQTSLPLDSAVGMN